MDGAQEEPVSEQRDEHALGDLGDALVTGPWILASPNHLHSTKLIVVAFHNV